MTTMRSLFVLAALAAFVALAPVPARRAELHRHHQGPPFQPAEIKVPADKRITVTVVNDDPTPEEFESHELKVEKVIPGKSKGDRALRAAQAKGRYKFFGEYHEDTAKGAVMVE